MIARATHLAVHGRRRFLGALASVPLFTGIGATFFARKAEAATSAITWQILEAAQRCHDTKKAFDDALAACEAALPPLPTCLDMTNKRPRPFPAAIERRYFDGRSVKRGAILNGIQQHRYVATVETLNEDLSSSLSPRLRRGVIYRMRRRAAKYETAVQRAEEAFRLRELGVTHEDAKQALTKLGEAIFDEPATTSAAVQVQARMLTAYVTAVQCPERHGPPMAGQWGERLAAGVLIAQAFPSGARR